MGVPTTILIMVEVVRYSQPTDHGVYEPLAVTAQSTAPQPFIDIAKQGKAAVVKIPLVKNGERGTDAFRPIL